MRILIGTDTYPPTVNGAANFSERLAHGLVGRGHDVHVVCPSPDAHVGPVERDGMTLHHVRAFDYWAYKSFRVIYPWQAHPVSRQLIKVIDPEVVHLQDHFLIGRGLAHACRKYGYPLVATNHLVPENFFDHVPVPAPVRGIGSRWLWDDLERAFSCAAVVTSPTQKAVDLLEEATDMRALAVSNGIDVEPYAAAEQRWAAHRARADHVPTILFVGRLDQEKRVNDPIRAMAKLPADLPAKLEIVGQGGMRHEWEQLAKELGLGPDRIEFRGFIDDDELLETYGRADLFCMPGVAELQSLVTMEAMAAGMPVVAANAMALPHLVRPGRNGWLYEPGDVEDLVARLTPLLRDGGLRQRMGEASKEIVASHAMATTLDRFEELYELAIRTQTGRN